VAFETGKYEKYWDLSQEDKGWLIAVIETKETLRSVVDYVDERDAKAKAAQEESVRLASGKSS
jgi:hypothetical protein